VLSGESHGKDPQTIYPATESGHFARTPRTQSAPVFRSSARRACLEGNRRSRLPIIRAARAGASLLRRQLSVDPKARRNWKLGIAVLIPKPPMRFPLTSVFPRLVKGLEEKGRSHLAVLYGIDHVGRYISARSQGLKLQPRCPACQRLANRPHQGLPAFHWRYS
jgi:hypothetical protein